MAKSADAKDLKSLDRKGRVGSTPISRTKDLFCKCGHKHSHHKNGKTCLMEGRHEFEPCGCQGFVKDKDQKFYRDLEKQSQKWAQQTAMRNDSFYDGA